MAADGGTATSRTGANPGLGGKKTYRPVLVPAQTGGGGSGGGGGGALQISTPGQLTLSGSLVANGGHGGWSKQSRHAVNDRSDVMTIMPNNEPNLSTGEDDDYAGAFISDGTPICSVWSARWRPATTPAPSTTAVRPSRSPRRPRGWSMSLRFGMSRRGIR